MPLMKNSKWMQDEFSASTCLLIKSYLFAVLASYHANMNIFISIILLQAQPFCASLFQDPEFLLF